MEKQENSINVKNRKAFFEYTLLDKYIAGVQLKGTEIKSIREGKISFTDSFCFFEKGELWIKNMHISEYSQAAHYNHEPLRNRKLLLKKKELKKISNSIIESMLIVPLRLFINDKGFAKIEISLAKGKKLYDKRETIKKREVERDIRRSIKA